MNMTIRERQELLKRYGYYSGRIDGDNGPQTIAATIAFKKFMGLRARPFVGPITAFALRRGIKPAPANIEQGGSSLVMPPWLRLAYSYLGLREVHGPRHHAEILRWWEKLQLPFKDDETPWCAGFVNAMVQAADLPIVGKNRAAALGWRWNGYGTRLDGPALGAIMSMVRPGRAGSGHMTFVAGRDLNGNIMGLGGNQSDRVSINPYHPSNRNAQYHWPEGVQSPSVTGIDSLPLITSNGSKLTNEA